MKRIIRYIMITGLVTALSAPVTMAREGRQGRGGSRTEQSNTTGRPGSRPTTGNTARPPQNNTTNRPNTGNNSNRPQPGSRPGNNTSRPPQNNNNNRPPQNNNVRPPQGNNRPDYGFRPGNNHGYQPGHQHGFRPAPPPPPRHDFWPRYHRPVPPPNYVYSHRGPSFATILGMVIGTAFNNSLNYLYSNGYNVSGCTADAIFLNNVSQMNYTWPDAVLHYSNGILASSQYIYSTSWNDTNRYMSLYNTFCNQYGYPASVSNTGGAMSASWFGGNGRFVTISYNSGYNANGGGCFYTTLTFGN